MNSMNGGLLYADKPTTHGRARLSRALLTLAIPPLACGFVIGLSWGSIGGVFVMPDYASTIFDDVLPKDANATAAESARSDLIDTTMLNVAGLVSMPFALVAVDRRDPVHLPQPEGQGRLLVGLRPLRRTQRRLLRLRLRVCAGDEGQGARGGGRERAREPHRRDRAGRGRRHRAGIGAVRAGRGGVECVYLAAQ